MNLLLFGDKLKALRKAKGITQEEVANALNISRGAYIGYEKGQNEPRATVLINLANYFRIDINHFFGDEFITLNNVNILTFPVSDSTKEIIIYVPQEAKAGYLEGFEKIDYVKDLRTFSLPKHEIGTFRAFEIKGDSMPPIKDGFIVIGKYIDKLDEINSGKRYILVTSEDGIVFKRVHLHEKNLILSSDNHNYSPYALDFSDIKEIWQFYSFVGFPEYEGSFSEQITQRLDNIEDKISQRIS